MTLTLGTPKRRLSVPAFAAGVLLIFFAGYVGARATGHWRNGIGDAEYVRRVGEMHGSGYGHPGMDEGNAASAPGRSGPAGTSSRGR
jgi:hypothetical protein